MPQTCRIIHFFIIRQSSLLMCFPLLRISKPYPFFNTELNSNLLHPWRLPCPIPVKANAFLTLKVQSTLFLTLYMVITSYYLVECLHNHWIPKISSSPWMFIKGIKGIDIWNDYIDEWLSHNMICVNLPNSLTVTQYKYSKTQEWIFRNLKAILRLTWQRVAELKLQWHFQKEEQCPHQFQLGHR